MSAVKKQDHIFANHNPELLQDVCDLFSGRRAGHMGKWMYSYPLNQDDPVRGVELWAKVIADAKNGSPYYVFNDERALIQKAAPIIASYLKKDCSLIDLGPGSVDAFSGKIAPIIDASPFVKEYVGVDISTSILESTGAHAAEKNPGLSIKNFHADFFDTPFQYPTSEPSELAVLFGLTLFNLCVDPRVEKLPELLLRSYLNKLKRHFRTENGLLVITQDTNQDPESLAHAYETNRDYQSTLLYRISRDLPVWGEYDPKEFELMMDFYPETNAYAMSFRAKKKMRFSIGQEAFEVGEGDQFYFHNCFKFNAEQFMSIVDESEFQHLEMLTDGKKSVLHILKPL